MPIFAPGAAAVAAFDLASSSIKPTLLVFCFDAESILGRINFSFSSEASTYWESLSILSTTAVLSS